MADLSIVGKSPFRVDALEKVTGKAEYVADFKTADICCGKLLRSPYPHARILSIDTSKAEKLPGVRAIVTGKDAPVMAAFIRDQYVIARDVVRFVGEPVAGVVADTEDIAQDALELIQVDYDELPAVFDPEEAMRMNPPVVIHPSLPQYLRGPLSFGYRLLPDRPNVFQYWEGYQGDVEKGFKEADFVIENRFSVPRAQHSCLERFTAEAWLEPDGTITVRTRKQGIHPLRGAISSTFDIPISKVRVISPYIGGAFGETWTSWPECIVVLLVLKSQRAIRVAFTREECFINNIHRSGEVIYIKDGVKKDGTIFAREIETILDCGAYSDNAVVLVRCGARGAVGQYRIPNFRMRSYGVYTNLPKTGSFRGVTNGELMWCLEQQMDILAEKLGIDPVEIRKRNLLKEGERNCLGQVTHSIGAEECLNKVKEWLEWDKPPEIEVGPWRRGKGLAVCNMFTAAYTYSFVNVKVYMDGVIEVRHGLDEIGQGLNTVLAQIAAEEFGISMEHVRIVRGDTALTPFDFWSASSRSTFYAGNALIRACQDAKKQIFQLAASRLGTEVEDLEIKAGKVWSKREPSKSIGIRDLFISPGIVPAVGEIVGKGEFRWYSVPEDPETGQTERWVPYYSYGAHGVEIAVNVETGEMKILRVAACFDMGQPINPKMCEQQIEGGIAWGIGQALYEEIIMNNGRILNSNFTDYRLPSVTDMPRGENVKVMIAASPHKEGPYGAKGIGEIVWLSLPPAVGNAFYRATGVRIKDLPLNSERVLKALKGTQSARV